MAVKIGHAVHDENGGLNGISGDQIQQRGKKGEEVQLSKWYVSGGGFNGTTRNGGAGGSGIVVIRNHR